MVAMAGMIKRESIDEVRDRVRIEDVVGEYVTLKPAGMGSLKGLCPFHDEKTPSFNVRSTVGRWHCFGCDEGGDAISFIEKIEHVSFVEAVEHLARKTGVDLKYDESTGRRQGPSEVTRARLIDAHRVAEDFYVKQLATPEGKVARDMLHERGFDDEAIAHFKVGYSPNSWDALLKNLRFHGFTEKEISASGLVSQGNRGVYDRFRGRAMWPIRSITGDPIGFGARKLLDDDQGPKYLNTPETQIYKKSQVLYGLDLAKKSISAEKRIVVVEGYTDVMAAHLAGITQAVATCGTAFGGDHVKIVRRLLGDGASSAAGVMLSTGVSVGGEIIFTFDGDAAGQKAALRAFQEDQSFATQTFVAISPNNMDPCEVRMQLGDAAVRDVVNSREPLFAFVIRTILKGLSLDTPEGRVVGLNSTAPIVSTIRDRVLRSEYTRLLSSWLGMEEHVVKAAVVQAARSGAGRQAVNQGGGRQAPGGQQGRGGADDGQWGSGPAGGEAPAGPVLPPRRQIKDPMVRTEREALEVILQQPELAAAAYGGRLAPETFTAPIHRSVYDAVRAAGGPDMYAVRAAELRAEGVPDEQIPAKATRWWVDQVQQFADGVVSQAVSQISVEPIPTSSPDDMWRYTRGIMMSLIRNGLVRQIGDVRSQMQRAQEGSVEREALFARLMELEAQRRAYDEREN